MLRILPRVISRIKLAVQPRLQGSNSYFTTEVSFPSFNQDEYKELCNKTQCMIAFPLTIEMNHIIHQIINNQLPIFAHYTGFHLITLGFIGYGFIGLSSDSIRDKDKTIICVFNHFCDNFSRMLYSLEYRK
jgi:hypothetical protein